MEKLESDILTNISFNIPFYKRYVDDIITAVPKDEIQNLADLFNNIHHRLQFTFEQQDNQQSIPFLDLNIKNNQGKLEFRWYQKKTFSGRLLHFSSNHPRSQKTAVVSGILHKAISNSSNESIATQNVKKAEEILLTNGYPRTLVLSRTSRTKKTNKPTDANAYEKIAVIPYKEGISQTIKRSLTKHGIKSTFHSYNQVQQFFTKLKDPDDTTQVSSVIYRLSCSACPQKYVGTTKQRISKRIYQHKHCLQKGDAEGSAAAKHMLENDGHNIQWKDVSILAKEENVKKRFFKEQYYIAKEKHRMNRYDDLATFPKIYLPLIDLI